MNDVLDFRIFVRAAATGSLSAAGRELGLSAAVISRRLSKLEERLGVRLLQRTTRQVTLTEAGRAFYDQIVSALTLIEEAESTASGRASRTMGVLRVSAPTAFSRLHLAPRLRPLLEENPGLTLSLELSDDYVDLIASGVDVAVRVMVPESSSLIARRLAPNRRLLCATPEYLERHGVPASIADLQHHRLLAASNQIRWRLQGPEGEVRLRPASVIETNSSEVVRELVVAGLGIGLRSTWDVSEELRDGRLKQVLPQYQGLSDVGIYAVYASRRFVPLKIRTFVDYLVNLYGPEPYWDKGLPIPPAA